MRTGRSCNQSENRQTVEMHTHQISIKLIQHLAYVILKVFLLESEWYIKSMMSGVRGYHTHLNVHNERGRVSLKRTDCLQVFLYMYVSLLLWNYVLVNENRFIHSAFSKHLRSSLGFWWVYMCVCVLITTAFYLSFVSIFAYSYCSRCYFVPIKSL